MVRVDAAGLSHLRDAPGRQVRHLRPRDVPGACKAPILAISTMSLEDVDPKRVECWLRRGRRALAVCGDQWSSSSVARWQEHCHGAVLRESELETGIDGLCRHAGAGLARYLVPAQSLLPAGHQPSRRLLDVVTALGLTHPVHHVEQLARRSGMSRSHLVHVTRRELGCTPTVLCQMYVLLQANCAAVDGVSRADVAVMLGYSDTSAFAHVLASITEEQPWVLAPDPPCLLEETDSIISEAQRRSAVVSGSQPAGKRGRGPGAERGSCTSPVEGGAGQREPGHEGAHPGPAESAPCGGGRSGGRLVVEGVSSL